MTGTTPADLPHFARWRDVPSHLMTASRLTSLEFPRSPVAPAATVAGFDYRGKPDVHDLYNARTSPPTRTTTARLVALAEQSPKTRRCTDCGAHSQIPLYPPNPLCLACQHIHKIRKLQEQRTAARDYAIAQARKLLAADRAAVVQIDVTTPEPTPSGKRRPDTAARVRAVDAASGKQLVDVTVRLVGERAMFVPEQAVAREVALPRIRDALLGRPLVFWGTEEIMPLRQAAPCPEWRDPLTSRYRLGWECVSATSQAWHGEIDPYWPSGAVVAVIPPGTPARLLLHLQRIASSRTTTEQDSQS